MVDPRGTQYKFDDYFQAFGWSEWIPGFLPLWLAVLLAVFEFCIGIYLFFGIRRRTTSWLFLLFMSVMTPLTLYLALANPVSDCGCFGDAVSLTNWETFGKNVVLLGLSVLVFRYRRLMVRFVSERNQWMISLYSIFFAFVLAGFCIYYLPVFDFRPYHIGVNLPQAMVVPEGEEEPEYLTTFVLEKDGVKKEFTTEDYPEDTAWHFVDSRTVLVKEGYVPPVHDFSIMTWPDGEDITEQVLSDKGYTFLLISPYLEFADDSNIDRINELYDYCGEHGYAFYCLTASGDGMIGRWQDLTGADYPFGMTDEITLKTIVRSNPGLVLLKEGTVYNKWSCNNLPKEEDLNMPLEDSELGRLQSASRMMTTLRVVLWFLVPLFVLVFADRIWIGSKMYRRMKHKNRIINLLKRKEMRKKIVAGNWKMNKTPSEAVALVNELKDLVKNDNVDVVYCVPAIDIVPVIEATKGTNVAVGAENMYFEESGAYTGEISAAMLVDAGVKYVIIGHSERRDYFKEDDCLLNKKVKKAFEAGLTPILCCGESLEQREMGVTMDWIRMQIKSDLAGITADQVKSMVIAYEPIWAIGTGKTATADQAQEVCKAIRDCIGEMYDAATADAVRIQYGGSMNAGNAKELLAKDDIDGGLIGGASLKAEFGEVVNA